MAQRRYLAKATEWALGETDKGNEQIAVNFDILTPDAEVSTIVWYGYFTDKTWERTVESLRHMGWTGTDLADVNGLDANEVELVVEDETYEGKTFPRVRWVNKPGGGGIALKAPLTGDRAKSFAAQMKDKIKALDASGPKKTAPAAPRARSSAPPPSHIGDNGAPPLTDDDIPF